MEKIERKQSVNSDKKERDFFAINSLGQLLPIIFVSFFFAFVLGNQDKAESTIVRPLKPALESSEFAFVEEQNTLQNVGDQEEEAYLNTSPVSKDVKTLPIIENKQKKQPVQEKSSIKEKPARPRLPKVQASLPTFEVSQVIEKTPPKEEAYRVTEVEASAEIAIATEFVEELIVPNTVSINKIEPVEALEKREIKSLADVEVEIVDMLFKTNRISKEITTEEIVEETVVEITVEKTEEDKPSKSLSPTNYNSSDFKWVVNDYNYGVKKSADYTNTPDGKASYCLTEAGIVLKVNDLSNINAAYGIFVEKSEDGEEFNTIGIINAENPKELFYFDSECSFDGQHHYRFRSRDEQGEELEFGKISVARKATILPISSHVNASGKYKLALDSKLTQVLSYEIKEAWGSLNGDKGIKQLNAGENTLLFDLAGDPGLYFLTMSTENQIIELLIEKPGISPDLSFYNQGISGKQNFNSRHSAPFSLNKSSALNFDFYLKNGNTLIFNKGEYNSETVKIKKAKIGELPESLQARHSEESLWFMVSSEVSYLHQKVPVILEHNKQEIAAQINIFASKNAIRPISHFSPNGDGIQDEWKIPGIESCPNTSLMIFNSWGSLIYKTDNVTDENIWKGQKSGKDLSAGMYYYVLGQYGGWVYLER